MMGKRIEEHAFSIEINQKNAVRKMCFKDQDGQVFFEGFLGKLKDISLVEGVMLEIQGTNGLLKLDITQQEIEKCLQPKSTVGGEQ